MWDNSSRTKRTLLFQLRDILSESICQFTHFRICDIHMEWKVDGQNQGEKLKSSEHRPKV
jgi:hypothetical protein